MKSLERKFENEFRKSLYYVKEKYSNYVFFCVGTDKVIGDSFGPLLGQKLKYDFKGKFDVIGCINENVTYINAKKHLERIYDKYKNPCIIAIDSAVSHEKNIGKIIITNNKMKLGQSLDKNKYFIGDICIKAIVAKKQENPIENYIELTNTSDKLVRKLVKITRTGINKVMNK